MGGTATPAPGGVETTETTPAPEATPAPETLPEAAPETEAKAEKVI